METWPIDSELHAYKTVPPHPRAVALLVHGFGEHAGRYAATAAAFTMRGIAVYAYDHRGHGRSPGRRAVIERFGDLVADSLSMRDRVAALHPDLPMVLMGASMGGVIAVRSAQRDPRGLAGVVLIAPALAVRGGGRPLLRMLAGVVAAVAPFAPVAKLELAALSRDRAIADAYAADPLNHHGGIPARTAVELIAAATAALNDAPNWQLPTLIVHGDADRIAGPDGAERFASAASAADITLRLVPGAYHEPFNDPGGDLLIDDVATWILTPKPRIATATVYRPPIPASAPHVYTWWEGLAFGAAVNMLARLLGTNTGRYEAINRPWFAPPGWAFPVVWSINSALSIWGNLRVLNAPPSTDRTAYLRLWCATWLLYLSFGYAFFRRRSPLLGFLVTTNFLALSVLSAGRG